MNELKRIYEVFYYDNGKRWISAMWFANENILRIYVDEYYVDAITANYDVPVRLASLLENYIPKGEV